ncbi:MAG: AEC family transporter [Alphaproteobacteria bacterium]
MDQIIDIVLPVFGLLAVGYLAARLGLLSDAVAEGLTKYVFYVAIPLLIFRSIVNAPAPQTSPWGLLLAYFTGAAVAWAAATIIGRFAMGREPRLAAIMGLGAGYSNTVLLGLPLVLITFGDAGAIPFFILLTFHLPIMTTACVVHMELAQGRELGIFRIARASLKGLITQPVVVGLIAGVVYRLTGLPIPEIADKVARELANTAIPCALFALGLTMNRYGILAGLRPAMVITALKLVVHPAVVWLMATYVVGLDILTASVITVFAAAPTGINPFMFATNYKIGVAEISSAIALTTGVAVVTISILLALLDAGGVLPG